MSQFSLSDLTEADIAHMERQRAAVRELARTAFQHDGEIDFSVLQQIVDADLIPVEDLWRLQALGVCFGDGLVRIAPVHWRIIEDEWGRDPTLCWENAELQLHALTVLSKRIEDGEHPRVEQLARDLIEMGLTQVDKHWR